MTAMMMAMHDVRGPADRPVFLLLGHVLRTMLNAEHALDSAGHATDYCAGDAADYRAGDLRAALKAIGHAIRHAVPG
jgi:hypothetical protein